MCEPTTIMMVAALTMAAISTGSAMYNQQQQQKNANEYADKTAVAAQNAANSDYVMLQQKTNEVGEQEAMEATKRMEQAERERAKIRVAMGESGLVGNSQMQQLLTSYTQESFDTGLLHENAESKYAEIDAEKGNVTANEASRIYGAQSRFVNPFLGSLSIGGSGMASGLNAWNNYKKGSTTTPFSGTPTVDDPGLSMGTGYADI